MHDQLLSNGPFKKMCLSHTGNTIACFTAEGVLWVVSSDFATPVLQVTPKIKTVPDQMMWFFFYVEFRLNYAG